MAFSSRYDMNGVRFRSASTASNSSIDNIHNDFMHLAPKSAGEARSAAENAQSLADDLPKPIEPLAKFSNGFAADDDDFPIGTISTQSQSTARDSPANDRPPADMDGRTSRTTRNAARSARDAHGTDRQRRDKLDEDDGEIPSDIPSRRRAGSGSEAGSTCALLNDDDGDTNRERDSNAASHTDNWMVVHGEGAERTANSGSRHGSTSSATSSNAIRRESSISIAIQVFVPYLVAGFGMVGAGLVLDLVQHWNVFRSVSQIFIMVPALLGLKGNLEMTLASRLSTQANLGTMDRPRELWSMSMANIVLTQAQAIVVGFLVSVAAAALGWILSGTFDARSSILLGASAVLTSSLASLLLGTVMILVIILSRKCSINPDNVATPVAASLGDLTTLCLLAVISSSFYKLADTAFWALCVTLLVFIAITPVWIYVARRNVYTRVVVYDGWVPVISAMLISSIGGMILEKSVARFPGLAAFQPVINGVGGNVAAIQASRLSTALHQIYLEPGRINLNARHSAGADASPRRLSNNDDGDDSEDLLKLPPPDDGIVLRRSKCPNPLNTFFSRQMHSRTARVLLVMAVPGHLIFMYTIYFMNAGHTTIRVLFIFAYMVAAMLQIIVLLYIAHWLVQFLWKRGKDPDNFAIPYLTAIGDILGTGLLAIAFHILSTVGDGDADVGD